MKNAKTKHAARKPALLRNGAANNPRHTKPVAIPNNIGNCSNTARRAGSFIEVPVVVIC
jgi:hypothetical protein